MDLDTASNVLGYRITDCSPEKKKLRVQQINSGRHCEESQTEDKEEDEKEEPSESVSGGAGGAGKKSRGARNAKLRRLCQRRKNGSLAVPTWLHELWKAGNHSALSLQYEECGYNKVEEGWYSKEDMSRVLHWKKIAGAIRACETNASQLIRRSKYGGDDEYWVQVRETGTRELAEEREQRITQNTQDT
ncbi:unnamed protein product [Symbiodinium sp. CCMP2592]|nr:unnamed protein product [Symbiodinium sp. CCMP2592]